MSKENPFKIPDFAWEDQNTRLSRGMKTWIEKDPETWYLRMQLNGCNHQVAEMGLLEMPCGSLMDPVKNMAMDPDEFRKKYPGKLHFITCTDDGAVPWEICVVLAERHKAASCKILPTGLGDHSLMFFSPKE